MELNKETILELHKGQSITLPNKPSDKLRLNIDSEDEYAAVIINLDGTLEKPSKEIMEQFMEQLTK